MPARIIDPDEESEEEEVVRPRSNRGRPRQRQSRVINPDEEMEVEEEEVRGRNNRQRPRSRQSRASQSHSSQGSTQQSERPRNRRRQIDTIEEDDEETDRTSRPSRHRQSDFIEPDNDAEKQTEKSTATLAEAVLAAFALSAKGPIKETDFKPLLSKVRYRDWQDALNDLNDALSTAFGITLVYDGLAKLFFLRNDLVEIKSALSEMFEYGTLEQVRIDDGTLTRKPARGFDEEAFTEDDKKGLLFTLLASIMMSNNVEMGHKNWAVDEEIIKRMCIESLEVPAVIFEKLISSKTAEFVKDGWLRKKEEVGADYNDVRHYSWGPRAVATVSTFKVFEKFCMINQTPMLEWGNYEEVLKKLDQKNDLYRPRK